MALIVDQEQPNFKHFCKICKKGFLCGRALGGHMRAHGIGDESGRIDDDDEDHASDWEGSVPPPNNNKRMYELRTNPNRFKSCRVCENCGKEFLSWKSFFEHGKCSSNGAESLISSSEGSDGEDRDGEGTRKGCGWSKRRRSLRAANKLGHNFYNSNCPSSEEKDLAHCLMMLSNSTVDPLMVAEPEESCASASKEEERRNNTLNFIAPIAYEVPNTDKAKGVGKGLFECKACKKVFKSHQALGGHRASHKKVKGCYAAKLDQDDSLLDEDVITNEEFSPSKTAMQFHQGMISQFGSPSKKKSKVHQCSICNRVFSSGQALGGHKRCHWLTSNSQDTSSLANKFQHHNNQFQQEAQKPHNFINNSELSLDLKLDLNLPVTGTDVNHQHQIENNHNDDNNNNNNSSIENIVDDEADSKVKLAKLSELSGGSSPWLQVGIGSN